MPVVPYFSWLVERPLQGFSFHQMDVYSLVNDARARYTREQKFKSSGSFSFTPLLDTVNSSIEARLVFDFDKKIAAMFKLLFPCV